MLFKIDTEFGHVIVDSQQGPLYQDDGTPVNPQQPRPCKGCNASIKPGSHDPCIADLPGTYQACCGHGLDCSPRTGKPAGYVGLKDGRIISFSGLCGGTRIRAAVEAALQGQTLPEGFEFGERMWWEGLSDAQRDYVWQRIPLELARLVSEATDGKASTEAFLKGEQPWWDGLSEEQKACVQAGIPAALAQLVQEALASV